MASSSSATSVALRFVVLLGIVSLFADMTYEGARSVTGPYLAVLGASATIVGFVAGFGELVGYSLRLVSGYFADQTRRYWVVAIAGYTLNLLAVPALALAGSWPLAAVLIILERAGKAIRAPAKDAMLSHAGQTLGHGWAFGLAEALDQTGALMGPLIVALVLFLHGSYRNGFAVLLVPALFALAILLAARAKYPNPSDMEVEAPTLSDNTHGNARGFPRVFWLYMVAAGLVAAGFADFPLMAFHFEKAATVPDQWIPVFYAVGMGIGAVGTLVFGRLFDRFGLRVLALVTLVTAFFAPFAFYGGFSLALLGILLWGLGLGAHESLMKSAISRLIPRERRASAFGVFNTGFGIAWFLGSALLGILYGVSIWWLVVASVILQIAGVPFLWALSLKSPHVA